MCTKRDTIGGAARTTWSVVERVTSTRRSDSEEWMVVMMIDLVWCRVWCVVCEGSKRMID